MEDRMTVPFWERQIVSKELYNCRLAPLLVGRQKQSSFPSMVAPTQGWSKVRASISSSPGPSQIS